MGTGGVGNEIDSAAFERLTTEDSTECEESTAEDSVCIYGFDRVIAARRVEFALADEERTDHSLITMNEKDDEVSGNAIQENPFESASEFRRA